MRFYFVILAAACVSCSGRNHSEAGRPFRMPPPQPAFERQIRNAVDAGDGDYRVRALRDKLAAEPDNLSVRLDLARAYGERGFPEVALEHCRLAAERFPDAPEAALELARSLRKMDRRMEAAQSLDVYLARHPAQQSAGLPAWLGLLRDELGQWTEGEKAHRAALAASPTTAYLYNNLGYNLLMQKRNQEAAAEFRRALERDPSSVLARNNLGLALAAQADQALAEWKRVNDPATAHSNLAAVLIEQGRYAEARKEIDTALGYNRTHSAALYNLRLVSRLDGKQAAIPAAQPARTRWDRVRAALLGAFVGPPASREQTPPAAAAKYGRGL